jgi:cellulose biosynthesis protein BcsQ
LRKITVINRKGGTGKTMTAVDLDVVRGRKG